MPITESQFISIKDSAYSPHSSWAIWSLIGKGEKPKARMGDMSVFKESPLLFETLHTDVVLVALNSADRDIQPEPFSAFHDTSPHAMDYKMRYAFIETILWGSYLTDFFHGLRETDSSKVRRYLQDNPLYLEKSVERFKTELQFVNKSKTKPVLIALGSQVKDLLDQYLSNEYKILSLPHYSYSVMTKELYREQVLELVEKNNLVREDNSRL